MPGLRLDHFRIQSDTPKLLCPELDIDYELRHTYQESGFVTDYQLWHPTISKIGLNEAIQWHQLGVSPTDTLGLRSEQTLSQVRAIIDRLSLHERIELGGLHGRFALRPTMWGYAEIGWWQTLDNDI